MRNAAALLLLAAAGCAARPDAPVGLELPRGAEDDSLAARAASQVALNRQGTDDLRETLDGERVLEGTGVFVGAPGRIQPARQFADGSVMLNFVEADIKEVVQIVLGDTLGINYLLDPRVQGEVTLRSAESLSGDRLLSVLEAALRTVNAALIDDDGTYRIIPLSEAPRGGLGSGVVLPGSLNQAGYALSVVPLRYVSAQQMTELIGPIVGADAQVQADAARNILLVSAPGEQTQSITDAVTMFDVDFLRGLSLGLFPLKEVSAEVMATELQSILEAQTGEALTGVLSLTPIERLNAVLVSTKQPAYLSRIRTLLGELDRATGEGLSLYVYPVQNGSAADLAGLLNEMFTGQTRSTTLGGTAPGVRSATLSRQAVPSLESPGGQARPAPAARSLLSAPQGGVAAGLDVRVIADETNNALVILANARDYRIVERALNKLDITPLQILIEATIAEVTLNDRIRYGVQFLLQDTFGGSIDSAAGVLTRGGDFSIAPQLPGFAGILNASGGDVTAILSALEALTEVNVISTPQLLVRDNQTAELQVGDEVPVVTERLQTAGGGGLDPLFGTSIEFIDTGVLLNVTPRITSGGLISLDIEQEVSSVSNSVDTGILTPTISTRRIASSISVSNRETVVLGGLISETNNRSSSGIPYLGRVPGLGWLFSAKDNSRDRTELVVLIRPTIVGNKAELREVSRELLDRLEGVWEVLE
ncbi:type II secretion system secretin GspD [Parvularcula maris]|uniref:Type II secretion system secretin GspD n=1 Tax=Parvularcula maris TaxID=2965077 RepID=A0A9X2LBG4_9PROT|nr:type II secretion system secretin GspD [Parvularcula maris]MCQ8186491.1 type II secretion system secretin GspD [Parvularcula maris]